MEVILQLQYLSCAKTGYIGIIQDLLEHCVISQSDFPFSHFLGLNQPSKEIFLFKEIPHFKRKLNSYEAPGSRRWQKLPD
jgi:hypothetical protein